MGELTPPSRAFESETRNIDRALTDFKAYMKFNYPDWKIYGTPVAMEMQDYTYKIQFTTIDPHIRYQKEVIIVEMTYLFDYRHFNFRTTRGILY